MKLTKTTALKASLLLVLAANMSWEQIDFGSTELAGLGTPGEAVAAAPAAAAAATTPTTLSTTAVKVSAPATTPVTLKSEATAVAAKLEEPSHTSDKHLLVCGEKYQVHYQQEDRDGVKKTRVAATRLSSREDGLELVIPRKLLDIIGDQELTYARLGREIKAMRADKKQTCAGDPATATTTTVADAKSDEEKTKLAEDVKNCKADKNGKTMKSDKIVACLTRELGRIDKRIDKKDEEGKRLSERQLARNALSEITKLGGTLKSEIRKGLLSKKEMDVEDAERAIDDAIEAIESAGAEFGDDDEVKGFDRSVAKLVDELKALKKAGQTRKEALALKERGEDVKKNMRDSYQAILRDPLNPQADADYRHAINNLNLLRTDIGRDFEQDELLALQGYKRRQMISGSDYNDFVKPYTELQKLLRDAVATPTTITASQTFSGNITGSVLGSDYAVPANLASRRAEQSAAAARALGTTLPTARPTVQPNLTLQAPRSTFGQ